MSECRTKLPLKLHEVATVRFRGVHARLSEQPRHCLPAVRGRSWMTVRTRSANSDPRRAGRNLPPGLSLQHSSAVGRQNQHVGDLMCGPMSRSAALLSRGGKSVRIRGLLAVA